MGYVWVATFIGQVVLSFYLGFTCNFIGLGISLTLFFLALLYSSFFGYWKFERNWHGIENVIGIPMFFAVLFAICGSSTKTAINEYKIASAEYTATQLQFKSKEYNYTHKWVEYKGIPYDYSQLPNGNYKLTRRLK